jgi:hypothetical protein
VGGIKYPKLPDRRSSIILPNTAEGLPTVMPWDIPIEEFRRLPAEEIKEYMQTMQTLYNDYQDVLLVHSHTRDDLKEAISQTKQLESKLREEGDQLVLTEEELRREKTLVQAFLERGSSGTPVGSIAPKESRSTKLPDPPVLTDGKEPTIDNWAVKIRTKLSANADHYPTEALRMAYLASRVDGTANLHLQPRLRPTAVNRFETAEDMIEALDRVFGDPNKQQTAMTNLRKLYQGNKDFNEFWGEFQRLMAELDTMPKEFFLEEFRMRVSSELKRAMITVDIEDVSELAKKCQEWDRRLQQSKMAEARSKFRAPTPSTNTGTPMTSVTNSPTTAVMGQAPRRFGSPGPRPAQRESTPDRDRMMREGRCFRCRQVGHVSSLCPDRTAGPVMVKPPVVAIVDDLSDSGKE